MSGKENYQDELRKPDPLLSVYSSVQDTKSGDIKKRSKISGQSYQRLAQSYKELEHEIDSFRTQYSNEKHLGILTEQAQVSSSHCFSLIYQKEIRVRFGIMSYSTIYSCAILSRERLMIATDTRLRVVNINTGRVEQNKSLYSQCSDIAVLPNDQVAVTLYWDDKIVILSTNDMSLIRSIPTEFRPSGITYRQDELYLVCGRCVNILNLQGDLLRKVKCDKSDNGPFTHIAVSMDAQSLYISGYKSLNRYSAQGQVIAVYTFESERPLKLTLLTDGPLVVVSKTTHGINTIHHISADLQQGYELKMDKGNVNFIGVDPVNNQIYAICEDCIKVYYMQKQPIQCQSEMKLTAGTADEKVSSFKAGTRFSYLKAHSHETDEIVLPLPRRKLSSRKHRALQFGESSLSEAGTRFPSLETDEELASYKARTRLPSQKTDKESVLFKFLRETREDMCQLM